MLSHNLEFFEEYPKKRLSFYQRGYALYGRFHEGFRSFSFCAITSLLLHMTVLGLVVYTRSLRHYSGPEGDIVLADREAFFQAMSMLRAERSKEATGEDAALTPSLSEEEMITFLAEAPALDSQLTRRERIEIFHELLDSWLGAKEGHSELKSEVNLENMAPPENRRGQEPLSLRSGSKFFASGPYAPGGTGLYKISPELSRRLAALRSSEKYERDQTLVRGGYVRVAAAAGYKDVPAGYYFRDCPYEEMMTVGANLFYLQTGFHVLKKTILSGRPETKTKKSSFSGPGSDFVVFLLEPGSLKPPAPITKKSLEALALRPGEMDMILDELMELPEEEQFTQFVSNYLERYNPDKGDLALLTKEFINRNLGMVFIATSPFQAAFDFLEEIYFNKRTQSYLEACCKDYRETKLGTEILFILAALTDFEKRTLGYLFDAYESVGKVLTGREKILNVFSPKAKAFAIKGVMEAVLETMEKAGIQSEADLIRLYENYEASLYELLAESGGETRDRALFALGCLFWNSRKYDEAVKTWKSIRSSYERRAFKELQRLIQSFESVTNGVPADYSLIASRVDDVLARENGSRTKKQLRRMIPFKKWSLRYRHLARH